MLRNKSAKAVAISATLCLLFGCSSEPEQSKASPETAASQPDLILQPVSQPATEPITTRRAKPTTSRYVVTQPGAARLATTKPATFVAMTQPTRLVATRPTAATLPASNPTTTSVAVAAEPQEAKPFIDEIRAAVRWLDKNAAIISQSEIKKQSGDLSKYFKKRGMFVGRFLIRLDPKQSPPSAASRERWEALTPHYYIENPVSKRLKYYETQRLQERVQRAVVRRPENRASINERHRQRLEEMKQRMETIELRLEFTGPHIDVSKVKELRKKSGNVVCEVTEVLVATDVEYSVKSSERIYKRYIHQITVQVVEQR